MQYMWLYVQYHDSLTGHVRVSPCSFNADVLLQKRLKSIVPHGEWQWLEQKYGFKFAFKTRMDLVQFVMNYMWDRSCQ